MDKLSFLAEWFDIEASVVRQFYFSFFPSDCTIEMFDIKNHKMFLKRTQCSGVSLKDIFVGNNIKIFSRQIKIVDYADNTTRGKMEISMQKTFAMIKPDAIDKKGEILDKIIEKGFQISQLKMTKLQKEDVVSLYRDHKEQTFYPLLLDHIMSGPVIGMQLIAEGAVNSLIDLVGPPNPIEAKTTSAGSIRAQFGQDLTRNAIHAAQTSEKAKQELELFFGNGAEGSAQLRPIARLTNSTCCVIKPHAVQQGLVGKIISLIEKHNYVVTGLQLFYLNELSAEEFLEVYKGIVSEYMSMVKQLSSGPCVALEVSTNSPACNVLVDFRKFVGPANPEVAKQIRPNTIRAMYGKSFVENAVHVTDLPEDASLEVEYFFKILTLGV